MHPSLLVLGLLALTGLTNSLTAQTDAVAPSIVRLRPFVQNGRWGYLDSTATVRIAARFWAAGEFSEGLAAVRDGGRYCFVDATGQLVLPARYDYATEFVGGHALVWVAGRPQLIDRRGTNVLPAGLAEVGRVPEAGGPGHLAVSTAAGRHGLLSPSGQWLIDTLYGEVGLLREERVTVKRYYAKSQSGSETEREAQALLDSHGTVIIPFGKFSNISGFADGVSGATRWQMPPNAYSYGRGETVIIDRQGQAVSPEAGATLYYNRRYPAFHDQLALASFATQQPQKEESARYVGVVNPRGQVVFSDPELARISDFANGRAFGRTHDGRFFLLDKAGHRLNEEPFVSIMQTDENQLPTPRFAHGRQAVKVEAGYAAIDRTGRLTEPPRQFDFPYARMEQVGDLVIFWVEGHTKEEGPFTHCGFWDPATGLAVPTRFEHIDPAGYRHGLLAVLQDGRRAYLNSAGKMVWQQEAGSKEAILPFNVDYMGRSNYLVLSQPLPPYNFFGGWPPGYNPPRPAPPAAHPTSQPQVLLAATPRAGTYQKRYAGYELTVANTTADTVLFDVKDSCLFANMQAQDEHGRWQDIEYMPYTFCGNSYSRHLLPPGQQWAFTVPAYAGSQPTRLRLKLTINMTYDPATERVVYSNEVLGSINPGQFWRKRGYEEEDVTNLFID